MKHFLLMILSIVLISVLALPVFMLNIIRKLYRKESIQDYFKVISFGFDQVGGSIIYSQEDWKVSSWTYRLEIKGNKYAGYFRRFIDYFFGHEHCMDSFIKEAHELNFKGDVYASK